MALYIYIDVCVYVFDVYIYDIFMIDVMGILIWIHKIFILYILGWV
jgi:hypothetical protein